MSSSNELETGDCRFAVAYLPGERVNSRKFHSWGPVIVSHDLHYWIGKPCEDAAMSERQEYNPNEGLPRMVSRRFTQYLSDCLSHVWRGDIS